MRFFLLKVSICRTLRLLMCLPMLLLSTYWSAVLTAEPLANESITTKKAEDTTDTGQSVFQQQCQSCHGQSAEGNQALKAPRLAGQSAWYINNQLKAFQQSYRGASKVKPNEGSAMLAIAKDLSEQQISAVSDYLEAVQLNNSIAATLQPSFKADGVKGKQYYQSLCGSCHGPGGKGNKLLNAPKLAGLNDWYIVQQIQAYKTGQRGYHPKDRLGKQMKLMSRVLPNEQALKDVAHFLSQQKTTTH